ncbi:hypothetical protein [Eubacterium oxidoreducens]|uniref:TrbC/VIRB2 family protein n=1 Tax=Eubacterium oxidoreducens TaxID=1732 RepID=A0A1G6C3Y0_EUBOX|nr:hypothetical protein [Eubacterium oxidoreducens]SDB27570.1 hypothetical protein SAMN02910417_02047 [Eubacterium oxidoreducens]
MHKLKMVKDRLVSKASVTYYSITGAMIGAMHGNTYFAEEDLEETVSTISDNIQSFIRGISTASAGVAAAICIFLIFFSKNERTVDSSISWLKRIIVAYVAILALSIIIGWISGSMLDGTGIDVPD